jgi:signal peptidase II
VYHVQGSRGIAVEARRPGALLIGTLLAVVALDQVTKAFVRASMEPSESIVLIRGIAYLTHVRNTGAAFGLMPGQRTLFILTSVLVLLAIAIYWWRVRPRSLVLAISLGLVSGGAIGNLIDRVAFGRVTDFFDIRILPIFNIADMAIVGGAIGLFAWALFAPIEHHEEVFVTDSVGATEQSSAPEVHAETPGDLSGTPHESEDVPL